MHQWRDVYWVTFAILIISAIIFSIWASGEIQPWNYPDKKDANIERNSKN